MILQCCRTKPKCSKIFEPQDGGGLGFHPFCLTIFKKFCALLFICAMYGFPYNLSGVNDICLSFNLISLVYFFIKITPITLHVAGEFEFKI